MGVDSEGCGTDLIDALSLNLHAETYENQEKPQSVYNFCPGRNSNRGPPKCATSLSVGWAIHALDTREKLAFSSL
jgi:hypothetical protein